jgi:hypothetical protein
MTEKSQTAYLRYLQVFAAILIVVVAAIAIRNKILMGRWARDYQLQKTQFTEFKQATQKIQDALIKANNAAMIHLGTTIKLVNMNMKKIFPADPNLSIESATKHPKLLMVFSELSCNVCRDEETQFGASIANEYGQDYVMAVVFATQRQYVANYVRLNQINFPVFLCADETFFKENGIQNTPMIFVLDEENRVIASHYPLPGHLEYSESIHLFCYHYFNRFQK